MRRAMQRVQFARQILGLSFSLSVSVLLAGCAVSPQEVSTMRENATIAAEKKIDEGTKSQRQESSLTRVAGNFIGDQPIDLPYAATLPRIFFERISLQSQGPSFGTVTQAARNITLATDIPVTVTPDVENSPTMSANAQAVAPNATPNALPPTALMTGSLPPPTLGFAQPQQENTPPAAVVSLSTPSTPGWTPASAVPAIRPMVKLHYQGTLLSYVKMIASAGGVDWEYHDGVITFRRLVTKVFTLSNISPGNIESQDDMSKGGEAATGQAGGPNAKTTGNFTSTSKVGTKGNYSLWTLLRAEIESAITTAGKFAINEGAGTVTVTDTKDAVGRIEKIVERENNILGRQVSIDVRVIRVAVNNQSQAGLNLNVVYSLFDSAGSIANSLTSAAPTTLTTASTGSLSFAVTDATSRFSGTNIALQGLNQFGNVMSDSTNSVTTTNRIPAMTGRYNTTGYLAQTTPASGGGVAGGQGVPGLTPGSTTTGTFLRILPTIRDNNTILINMSLDVSQLLGFGSASTGAGSTFQQIQWANTDGSKNTSNLLLNQNESMVMVGIVSDDINANNANGLGGGSMNATRNKILYVLVVTPRIMKGM